MKRNSSNLRDNRELPEGARQSNASCELASELLAEDFGCVGSDGTSAVEREKASLPSGMMCR
ncbi:MAG: hypothetical protein E7293_05590 [Lachnospiraceae bacterium]|nr:hypothetical protein [Lachnospiraceae bacterium]